MKERVEKERERERWREVEKEREREKDRGRNEVGSVIIFGLIFRFGEIQPPLK